MVQTAHSPDDFRKMKEFLASVIQDFDISNNKCVWSCPVQPHLPARVPPGECSSAKRGPPFQIENIKQIFGYTHWRCPAAGGGALLRPDMGSRIHTGTPRCCWYSRMASPKTRWLRRRRAGHKGIDIYSVGIGDVDDQQLVQILPGTADKKLTVHNFGRTEEGQERGLLRNICTSGVTAVSINRSLWSMPSLGLWGECWVMPVDFQMEPLIIKCFLSLVD